MFADKHSIFERYSIFDMLSPMSICRQVGPALRGSGPDVSPGLRQGRRNVGGMAARHLPAPDPVVRPDPCPPQPEEPAVIRLDARRPRPVTRRRRGERRRLVTLMGASLLALGLVALVQSILASERAAAPSLEPLSSVDGEVYVVQPGDTLWTIAQRLVPEDDPRPLVAEIRSRNGGAEVDVGDRLDLTDL